MSHTLTHLKTLESESIHIIREVVAEFENPVMLYSVGKDSAVMLHLAQKAFAPATPPFPLLHVDTTWKFKEMIEFRDRMAKEVGMDLLVHINQDGVDQGVGPFTHGSKVHTDIMKTQALKQALNEHKFDAAFGALAVMKRGAEPRNACTRSVTRITAGTRRINGQNCGTSTTGGSNKGNPFACSHFQTGPNLTFGNTFGWNKFLSSPSTLQGQGLWSRETECRS